ncbi:hypothetical protein D3C87_1479350 [compost metagenome]
MDVVRIREVRLVHLHEVDAHEERLLGLGVAVQVVQRCLFHVAIKEGYPHDAFTPVHHRRIDILAIYLEFLARLFPGVAGQRALRDSLEHFTDVGGHVGEPRGIRIGVGVQVIQPGVLHLVVALGVGQGIVRFAQMPLASKERLVARRLQDRPKCPFRRGQAAALALERHRRHAAAVWYAAGLHGGPAWRATGLRVEREEGHAFGRKPVDVGRWHAAPDASAIWAKVAQAGVV